jgi:hypothetical protein
MVRELQLRQRLGTGVGASEPFSGNFFRKSSHHQHKKPSTERSSTVRNVSRIRWRLTMPLLIAVLACLSGTALAQKKPNILILWGDDIGYWNISAYNQGMMGYKTPNIDRLAREGAPSSRIGTASRAAPPDGPRSSPARVDSAPGCSRLACRARKRACRRGM